MKQLLFLFFFISACSLKTTHQAPSLSAGCKYDLSSLKLDGKSVNEDRTQILLKDIVKFSYNDTTAEFGNCLGQTEVFVLRNGTKLSYNGQSICAIDIIMADISNNISIGGVVVNKHNGQKTIERLFDGSVLHTAIGYTEVSDGCDDKWVFYFDTNGVLTSIVYWEPS